MDENKLIDKYTEIHESCREELKNYIDSENNDDDQLVFLEFKVKMTGKALNTIQSIKNGDVTLDEEIVHLEEWTSKLKTRVDSNLEKDSDENKVKMLKLEYEVGLLNELVSDLKK